MSFPRSNSRSWLRRLGKSHLCSSSLTPPFVLQSFNATSTIALESSSSRVLPLEYAPARHRSGEGRAWEVTKSIVQEGAIVRELKETRSGTIRRTNFPTQKQTIVAHVRPLGMRDTFPAAIRCGDGIEFIHEAQLLAQFYLKSVIAELQAALRKL